MTVTVSHDDSAITLNIVLGIIIIIKDDFQSQVNAVISTVKVDAGQRSTELCKMISNVESVTFLLFL